MTSFLDKARRVLTGSRSGGRLLRQARQSGDPFKHASYFAEAEPQMDALWQALIWPRISGLDFTRVLDLAAGHGRNSAKLAEVAGGIVIVEINEECLAVCRRRFAGDPRFEFLKTDGISLRGVADASITLVYSFDSMVHFAPEVVRAYVHEFRRVLRPGGHGFCHHSNFSTGKGDFRRAPHWRNRMSRELFASYCTEAGLEVLRSDVIDWGGEPEVLPGLDCLTLFRRP